MPTRALQLESVVGCVVGCAGRRLLRNIAPVGLRLQANVQVEESPHVDDRALIEPDLQAAVVLCARRRRIAAGGTFGLCGGYPREAQEDSGRTGDSDADRG